MLSPPVERNMSSDTGVPWGNMWPIACIYIAFINLYNLEHIMFHVKHGRYYHNTFHVKHSRNFQKFFHVKCSEHLHKLFHVKHSKRFYVDM